MGEGSPLGNGQHPQHTVLQISHIPSIFTVHYLYKQKYITVCTAIRPWAGRLSNQRPDSLEGHKLGTVFFQLAKTN
jgi:hypothetical protein